VRAFLARLFLELDRLAQLQIRDSGLDRGLEQTPDGVRGENHQVEGPLYEEAGKSTAKNGALHFTN
jgi:hypothetical protein